MDLNPKLANTTSIQNDVLIDSIEQGKFDAKTSFCFGDGTALTVGQLIQVINDKDAEIARLNEKYNEATASPLIEHLRDRVLELEQHQGRDRADLMEKIRGLEHRLGLAQDRIAEIHPSGCVPPGKSGKTCSSCRNWQGTGDVLLL